MTHFISDTHFNHAGSLKWNNGATRPQFSSVEEMNQTMINNWNSVVTDSDEVYHLGDFAYRCSKQEAEKIWWQLNGKKHLIKGNHDHGDIDLWESVSDIKELIVLNSKGCNQLIVLCHYPIFSWKNMIHESWHLHGHVHGSMQELNKEIKRHDCSVEVNNYTPISLEQIENIMK